MGKLPPAQQLAANVFVFVLVRAVTYAAARKVRIKKDESAKVES